MGLFASLFESRPQASSRDIERQIRSVYGGGATSTGINVNSDNAMRVGAVYACVLVLSQSIAQLPIHIYRKNGKRKEIAADHPLYPLIHDQPNEWMTDFEMKQLIMVHLCLRGNSVWLKTRGIGGRVAELIPIHPDRIQEIVQDERYRLFYKISRPGSGEVDSIPGHKLIHIRGLSTDGFSGLNPIAQAREMIGLAIATEKHGGKLFSNGARIGGILIHPKKLSPTATKYLEESFNATYSGVENAHKTAILEEGMEWKGISMTAEDSQFLETRKYQRSEIAGLFRVPSHMINDLEKATFSNVEHLDLAFVKHSLMPWAVGIEKTLRKDLLSEDEKESLYFKFNAAGMLRGDIKSRYEAYGKGILDGWLSPNEVREWEDLDPYDGGDEYRRPLNTEPSGGENEPEAVA